MRGALSVALVATLPIENVGNNNTKDIIATLTFGVVLLSLIIQYVAITKYVKKAFPNEDKC